jgi:hypothetical protein
MEAIQAMIDELLKPHIDRLNSILNNNVALLEQLNKMTRELENSPVRDLPSYRKKMEHRIENTRVAILLQESFIDDVRKDMDEVLAPFRSPVSLVGSINL